MAWAEFESFISDHSAKIILVMFLLIIISLIVASVGMAYVLRLMPLNALADATAGTQTMQNRRNMQRYSSSDPSSQSVYDLQGAALTAGGSIGGAGMRRCSTPGTSSDSLWDQLNSSLSNTSDNSTQDTFSGLIASNYDSSLAAASSMVYAAPTVTGTLSNSSASFTNRRR